MKADVNLLILGSITSRCSRNESALLLRTYGDGRTKTALEWAAKIESSLSPSHVYHKWWWNALLYWCFDLLCPVDTGCVPVDQIFRFEFPNLYVKWNGIFYQAGPISSHSHLGTFYPTNAEVAVLSAASCFMQRNWTRIHDYFKHTLAWYDSNRLEHHRLFTASFCAGVQFSRDYIRAFKYMYEKIEGCEQSTNIIFACWEKVANSYRGWLCKPGEHPLDYFQKIRS